MSVLPDFVSDIIFALVMACFCVSLDYLLLYF